MASNKNLKKVTDKLKEIPWIKLYIDKILPDNYEKMIGDLGDIINFEVCCDVINVSINSDNNDSEILDKKNKQIHYRFAYPKKGLYIIAGDISGLSKLDNIKIGKNDGLITVIHYCVKGGCEVLTKSGLYSFMKPQSICIESHKNDEKKLNFIEDEYEGVEIVLFEQNMDSKDREFFNEFGIDVDRIHNDYNEGKNYKIGDASDRLNEAENMLYSSMCGEKTDNVSLLIQVLNIWNLTKTEILNSDNPKFYLTKGQRRIVSEIEEDIKRNMDKDITAGKYAKKYGISVATINKYFITMHGFTLYKYLTNVRMKKACEYLEFSDLNIAEISAMVGYENQGKFSAAFKKKNDKTPVEYRMNKKKYK